LTYRFAGISVRDMSAHLDEAEEAARCGGPIAYVLVPYGSQRALWAVRVLDASASHLGNAFVTMPVYDKEDYSEGWECSASKDFGWLELDPDAARIAAAEAVFPELPADVRQALGEKP